MRRTTPEVDSRATGGGVLFIDDDPLVVKVVQDFLEQEGFQVAVATSGMAGLDLARSDPPALFLLDIMMPGMDGFEVCEAIRRDHALCKVPVVVLTAMESQKLNERAFAVGAEVCMTKPFSPERLLNAVNIALHNAVLKRINSDKKNQKRKIA
ncbi:MAG: PleD family two-component system response regulator [Candidatus Methylomirabilales bacterium]